MRWSWVLVLVICAGCSSTSDNETTVFEWRDHAEAGPAGFWAEVELPAQLPQSDFVVPFRSENDGSMESIFEYAPAAHLDCYWHGVLPMICTSSSRAAAAMPVEISDGGHVRTENAADGSTRYVVYRGAGEYADFADFQEGELLRFGILSQESGAIQSSYVRAVR